MTESSRASDPSLLVAGISRIAAGIESDVVATRRRLHSRPELAFEEFDTARLIAERCRRLGLEVRTGVAHTGVVADLVGFDAQGQTILIRADMDALPIEEQTGMPYRSCRSGVMHACGHDGHVAVALGVAEVLRGLRRRWRGRVRFCFQPAEETDEGASEMIDAGVLEGVDAALGLHLQGGVPTGIIEIGSGVQWASSDEFRITVIGEGGHAAHPTHCRNPITAAAEVIRELTNLTLDPVGWPREASLAISMVQSGTAANVIPSTASITGTLRLLATTGRSALLKRIHDVAADAVARWGTSIQFETSGYCPPLRCDPDTTDLVRGWLHKRFPSHQIIDPAPSMYSDDMARFLQRVPGCYFRVGATEPNDPSPFPHHHPRFSIDENSLPIAVEALSIAALSVLERGGGS